MKRATKCGITALMLSAIIAWTGIPRCVACGINPPGVLIITPKASLDGDPTNTESWVYGGPFRFDFQGVTSSSPGTYNLTIEGLINPGSGYGYKWSLDSAAGTLTDDTSSTPSHDAPSTAGEGTLTLAATLNGVPVTPSNTDTREVKIYEDHLARDRANFTPGTSCKKLVPDGEDWEWQFTAFGMTIDMPTQWNCHGSTIHAYNGTGSGNEVSGLFPMLAAHFNPKWIGTEDDDPSWKESLEYGDIVMYFSENSQHLLHSQTVISGTTTFGANNKPLVGLNESWLWYESEAGEWARNADQILKPIIVAVYTRK